MMHEPPGSSSADARFLQVELNTIASSFGALSSRTGQLHRFLLGRYGAGSSAVAVAMREFYEVGDSFDLATQIPENVTLQRIPDAIAQAFKLYCDGSNVEVTDAIVLFVVQEG